jgi:DNA-binding CsgD family transcriptional regulator
MDRQDALARWLEADGAAVILISGGIEVARSAAANKLLDRWFASTERRAGALPDPLRTLLAAASGASVAGRPTSLGDRVQHAAWRRERDGRSLEARLLQLPSSLGRALWALLLQETPGPASLPVRWHRSLTHREREVVSRVLRGWTNRLIAEDVGCAEGTVKKHLQSVFDKLGVPTRAALQAASARLRESPEHAEGREHAGHSQTLPTR